MSPPIAGEERKRGSDANRLGGCARTLLGAFGLAAFGAGVAAVFFVHRNGGAGAAALLAIGAIGLALAVIGERPKSLGFGGAEISLPEKAERLAEEADQAGRPDVAESLRASAAIARVSAPFAQLYELLREIGPTDDRRQQVFDDLISIIASRAKADEWPPGSNRVLFATDAPGPRVFALTMMRAFPERSEDLDLALDAVATPRSRFEQLQALKVIGKMAGHLESQQALEVIEKLRPLEFRGSEGELRPSGERALIRDEILERLGGQKHTNDLVG